MKKTALRLFIAVIVICVSQNVQAQVPYDVPVAGATQTYVTGINDSSDFVGYYYDGVQAKYRGFGVFSGVFYQIDFIGAANTYCEGVNNHDVVVGRYNTTGNNVDNEGFTYDVAGQQYTDITSTLIPNVDYTEINDINDDGCWVGDYKAGSLRRFIKKCPAGSLEEIDYFDGSNLYPTFGNAITPAGGVLGYIVDGATYTSFLTYDNISYYFFNVPSQWSVKTKGLGISSNLNIVGDYGNSQGFYYMGFAGGGTSNSMKFDIPGAAEEHPTDINKKGRVVGYYVDGLGVTHGFVIKNYDLHFRPNVDGWNFSNSGTNMWQFSDYSPYSYLWDPYLGHNYLFPEAPDGAPWPSRTFPSWPTFVHTFTPAECYGYGNKMKDEAYATWSLKAQPRGFTGDCLGFSTTSLMNFDNHSWYNGEFHYLPGQPLYSTPIDSINKASIHEGQVFQRSWEMREWDNTAKLQTPNETMNQLKQMMMDSVNDDAAVGIVDQGPRSRGHALVAYRILVTDTPGLEYVKVYDSNFPGDTTRKIKVNELQGTNGGGLWYYKASTTQGGQPEEWGGQYSNGFYVTPKMSFFTGHLHPDKPAFASNGVENITAGSIQLICSDSTDNAIYNSSNELLGNVGGVTYKQISNGHANIPLSDQEVFQNDYTVDDSSSYHVVLSNPVHPDVRLYALSGGQIFGIDRSGANPAQTDLFSINNGLGYKNPDAASKSITITSILYDTLKEHTYKLSNLDMPQSDSLIIQKYGTDDLKVVNLGSAKSYDVYIRYMSQQDVSTFQYPGIPFSQDAAHIIHPFWDSLSTSGIYVYVDSGMNGTYDDTIFYQNTAQPIMDLSQSLYNINYQGGTNSVNVINSGGGTMNWTTSTPDNWITINTQTGVDDSLIQFTVAANSGAPRVGHIVINAPSTTNAPDTIEVYQADSASSNGITDAGLQFNCLLYPNPSVDEMKLLVTSEMEGDVTLTITDAAGNIVNTLKIRLQYGTQVVPLPVNDLPSGLYILNIVDGRGKMAKRMIKL